MVLSRQTEIIRHLRQTIPKLLAIYVFGSQLHGTADKNSDLDLAILVEGYSDAIQLWEIGSQLADITGCPIDLLDLRHASTVMQYQIITTGQRWWQKDAQAALYEAAILSDKTELDRARAPLLNEIYQRGKVYGQ